MSFQPAPPLPPEADARTALVVELEGTLLRTDPLLEAAFAHVRSVPSQVGAVAFGWLGGSKRLSAKIASSLDPATLPLDEGVLQRMRSAHAAGRRVVVIARSDRTLAQRIVDHLGCVDELRLPTDAGIPEAHERISATKRPGGATLRAAVKALRPHQWTKNLLVFVPAILAHAIGRPEVLLRAVLAFAAFSLCASSVYVLNDLLDLHADRAHHRKRNRPFASGALPLGVGLVLAPLLLASAAGIALLLPSSFGTVLAAYYVATLLYSLVLKRLVMVDVLLLAGLYTVRILAGAEAYDVRVSQWLLAFSLFMFLSLAFVKRYSELWVLRQKGQEETKGRGYRSGDLEQLSSLGGSAGYISVLVLALYVNSADVTRLYTHPGRLWGILPIMLFWVSRVWLLAHRGQMHDDPIVFAIRDRVSYAVAAALGAVVWLAI